MYDPAMVQPMRDELTRVGFVETRNAQEVDSIMNSKPRTALFFLNSVCGCSAGVARPAITKSVQNSLAPEIKATAFAGNDTDAVKRIREYFVGYPPSSPCAGLFRDGELVFMLERHQIEGQSAENVTRVLESAYQRYCGEQIDLSVEIYDPAREMVISQADFKALQSQDPNLAILDVREPYEIEGGKIPGSIPVDNETGNTIIQSWDRSRSIVVYCQHGVRSLQAVQFLKRYGFNECKSLEGGYAAWNS